MAIIDYGAIAFKNKKCIQTDEWTSPLETVGYTTDEMEGNYFSVIGDRDISVGFCKNYILIAVTRPVYYSLKL